MKEDENYINFIKKLKSEITQNKDNNIVFCCIGTDRVIGDCIGPITGSLLKGVDKNFNVYGDLNENLTFSNMSQKMREIKLKYKNPYVVAIDAALSVESEIGNIYIADDGIIIGRGLNKSKKKIGDIGIKVVVGKDYNDNELNFRCLQNISLSKIMDLSKKISDGIIKTFE